MSSLEVEFKYRADSIPFSEFKSFCSGLKGTREVGSFPGRDIFFSKPSEQNAFFRYRTGADINVLTFKRKTNNTDNFIRTEYNLILHPGTQEAYVEGFLKEQDYSKEFSLYKNSSIYEGDWFNLSYYICYNDDMVEVGRFVELELHEGIPFKGTQEAMDNLLILEKLCRPLGITPLGRVKQSLFEMYRPVQIGPK